jgi:hemerythrin-like domain-containing protein
MSDDDLGVHGVRAVHYEGRIVLGQRTRDGGMTDLLLECHARIRSFVRLAVALAQSSSGDEEVADAAGRLARYFSVALPLHVADEEESLRPRLTALASPPLAPALATMTQEHERCHELLAPLLAAWQALSGAPGDEALRRSTDAGAHGLAQLMEQHLRHEEHTLFPAAAQLPAEVQSAIVHEMRARRAPR